MKALIWIIIILVAVGLLFESMYKIKMVFENFSKNNNRKAGKDFNFDFKNQFNNISEEMASKLNTPIKGIEEATESLSNNTKIVGELVKATNELIIETYEN